ncbi:MAG: hypothetical protein KC643_02975 [Nitrospira sp.]|nr:hypothetical protein [Nitrospira sp.]
MGKSFKKEIEDLKRTYKWALGLDVSELSNFIRSTWDLPLLSVGSGGSFSVANFQSTLHQKFFQSIAQPVTPMELVFALPRDGRVSVWFMSATGNNVDIRRSFQHAALSEPKAISAIVGKEFSRLASLGIKYQYANLFEYPLPSGKDGFLATNSLFGFSTIIYRAYCNAANKIDLLPQSMNELVSSRVLGFTNFENLLNQMGKLWEQEVVHVIYSPNLKSVAVDIESKFIEAGLGSIHLADFRNFAHGRHHWFSKNENNAILALSNPEDFNLGSKTLNLLPKSVHKAHIKFSGDNGSELLVGLLLSIYFTHWRGQQKGIDPGRPGVPNYGSRIYHLTSKSGFACVVSKTEAAIQRKKRHSPRCLDKSGYWEGAHREFVKRISQQKFGGIVIDYDGTIVDSRKRFEPPSLEICNELVRLLSHGLRIGFATGRGKSIREALRKPNVIPKKYWDEILVGYYNGSDISRLSDECAPDGSNVCGNELSTILQQIKGNLLISSLGAEVTLRKKQLTIEPKEVVPENFLWEIVQGQIFQEAECSTQILRSSHSIDIIASGVTKLAVIKIMSKNLKKELDILSIGDRGRWPGNDSKLLSSRYSLSVDEVSFAKDKCWNLCPAGIKGPQGTLYYLKKLQGKDGVFSFK